MIISGNRTNDGRQTFFEAIIYPALALEKTGNTEIDAYNSMFSINKILEDWVREYPQQWFWVHKRWR